MLETCFLENLRRRFLLITGKSDNCLHYANIMSIVGICSNGLRKNSKSNETRVVAQSSQGRWIFFLELELFFILKICLLEIPEISFVIWAISFSFSHFKTYLIPTSRSILLLQKACAEKNFIFPFYQPYQRNKRKHYQWKLSWQSNLVEQIFNTVTNTSKVISQQQDRAVL